MLDAMVAKIIRLDEARARLPARRVERVAEHGAPRTPLDEALRAVATCPQGTFLFKARLFREVFRAEMERRRKETGGK